MSIPPKSAIDSMLRRGEIAAIYATVVLLFVVEFCFVYWLNHLPVAARPTTGVSLIVLPPWSQRPRFEVTLLLTIVAGLLFSICRMLWNLQRTDSEARRQAADKLRARVKATLSVTALAGCELFLVTWLRS